LRPVYNDHAHTSACWLPTDEEARRAERAKLAQARALAGEPA
jgi:hypothetical protein